MSSSILCNKLPYFTALQFFSFAQPGGESHGYDVTSLFFNRTIYLQSNNQTGWWLAATAKDQGQFSSSFETMRDVVSLPSSPKKVFHPDEPFRWEVVDCMQGYACLRTRFLEDGVGVGGNKIQDPKSFFLGIFDVGGFSDGMKIGDYYAKVFFDTNDPEIKGAHLKWKIICTSNHALEFSKIDYDECNFYNQDQMRPQLELYHDWNDGVLGKATFRMRKSTNTWNFLLMLPQFKEARK